MERQELENRLYEAYKMGWMVQHGKTLSDITKGLTDFMDESKAEGFINLNELGEVNAVEINTLFRAWEEACGFDGELWASKNEFLQEILNEEWVNYLMLYIPDNLQEAVKESYKQEFGELAPITIMDIVPEDNNEYLFVYVEQAGRVSVISFDYVDIPDLSFIQNNLDIEGSKEAVLRAVKKQGFTPATLPCIENMDPVLQEVWKYIGSSENITLFVEPATVEEGYHPWDALGISQKDFERRMDAVINKYGLSEVIVKGDGDALYTFYGDFQSYFSENSITHIKNQENTTFVDHERKNFDKVGDRLVEAGDWRLNPANFEACQNTNDMDSFGYVLGYVNYGNQQIKFNANPSFDTGYTVCYCVRTPAKEFGEINQTDAVDIAFEPSEWCAVHRSENLNRYLNKELYYEDDSIDYEFTGLPVICNEESKAYSNNELFKDEETFKRGVVGHLLRSNIISVEKIEQYEALKESGKGFFQQVDNTLKEYPSKLAKQDKLSIFDINSLTDYYRSNFADGETIVTLAVNAGFRDDRVQLICNNINKETKKHNRSYPVITREQLNTENLKEIRDRLTQIFAKSINNSIQK